jgi:hypothetical protein
MHIKFDQKTICEEVSLETKAQLEKNIKMYLTEMNYEGRCEL